MRNIVYVVPAPTRLGLRRTPSPCGKRCELSGLVHVDVCRARVYRDRGHTPSTSAAAALQSRT